MPNPQTEPTETAQALQEFHLPEKPSWDRARQYVQSIKRSMDDLIRLGYELAALRKQYYAERAGAGQPKSIAPHPAAQYLRNEKKASELVVTHAEVLGWQKKVREEIGISDDTARRIIERADAVLGLRRLQAGEAIEYLQPRTKEKIRIEATDDARALASSALEGIEAGTISAPRALTGFIGEALRREKAGSARKAATDHADNILTALRKLNTSLPHWRRLNPEDRAELETIWFRVRELLPDTWQDA